MPAACKVSPQSHEVWRIITAEPLCMYAACWNPDSSLCSGFGFTPLKPFALGGREECICAFSALHCIEYADAEHAQIDTKP